MRCNFNFNRCFLGPYYPVPIFICCRNLLNAISYNSENTVINPTTSFALFSSSVVQTVVPSGNVVTSFIAGSGTGITSDGAGNITLAPGTYRISYNAFGTFPANGTLSLALYQDGFIVPSSQSSTSGTTGNIGALLNVSTVTVTGASSIIRLVNTNTQSQTINSASIVITKIG